jgi:AcrR family transcriptional regulator
MSPAPPADATRERILDAAMACFAANGFAASIRAIAGEAGVSAALVIHHFGDKAGLRRACDAAALEALTTKAAPADEETRRSIAERLVPHVRYVARALIDADDGASAIFEALLSTSRRVIAADAVGAGLGDTELEDAVLALTAYSLAPLLLGTLIARHFGRDALDADLLLRLEKGHAAVAPLLAPAGAR